MAKFGPHGIRSIFRIASFAMISSQNRHVSGSNHQEATIGDSLHS